MDLKPIFDRLNNHAKSCRNEFDKFENLYDYFITFFSNSKKDEINLNNKKLAELKKKNVNEIKNLEKYFNDIDDLKTLIGDGKKIKYRESCFFMTIYNSKKNNDSFVKIEEQIFNDSIQEYKDTCKEIINQKETKIPFFDINNIKEIFKETQNKINDINKEIKFMLQEFADLDKDDYSKNNLLNDLFNKFRE